MHYRSLLPGVVLLTILSVSTTYAQISPLGLVAHWRYNGNAGDSSGRGSHGTEHNITYGAGKDGKPNTAAYFDGSSSYVSVPYKGSLNLANYTICATVKLEGFYTATCQVNTILQRGPSHTSGNYALLFADTIPDCGIIGDTNAYTLLAEAGPFTANVPMSSWNYPVKLHTGRWYTMMATFNGSKSYIYIDGKLVDSAASTSGPTPIGTSTDGLHMGAIYDNVAGAFPYWFKGYMDDVRIYSRVLTAKEVAWYEGNMLVSSNYADTVCEGSLVILPYELADTATVNVGDTVIAELSDLAGSFATPAKLGEVVIASPRSKSGFIICAFPGTSAGAGYKLRVATSTHSVVSPGVPVVVLDTITQSVNLSVSATNPLPGMDVIFAAVVTPKDSMASYMWLKNSMLIPGANDDTLHLVTGTNLKDGDVICVQVTSSYRCAAPKQVQACETIHTGSGIYKLTGSMVQVYPNPAGRQVTIAGMPTGTAIALTDMQGRVLYSSVSKEVNTVINTASLAAGVYILKLTGEDGATLTRRLIKD